MNLYQAVLPYIQGSLVTIELFAVTIALSLPLGFAATMLYSSKNRLVKAVTGFYILIMRGTPLLLQMFFIYFALPYIPYVGRFLMFDRFPAACIAFVLNYAAYFAEIFRGGLKAIDPGQYEASKALGMNAAKTMRSVIFPQMIRVSLPAIGNEAIVLVKDTALITALAVPDLLHITKGLVNKTTQPAPFVVAALFYLAMSYVITRVFAVLEKKYNY